VPVCSGKKTLPKFIEFSTASVSEPDSAYPPSVHVPPIAEVELGIASLENRFSDRLHVCADVSAIACTAQSR